MYDAARHVFEFTPESMTDWCVQRGMAPFRARQIFEWVFQRGVVDPAAMTDLAKRDRDLLGDEREGLIFLSGTVLKHQRASDGVQKLLVQWSPQARLGAGAGSARSRDASESSVAAPAPAATTAAATPPTDLDRQAIALPQAGVVNAGDAGDDPARQTECVMIPAVSALSGDERRTACISSQVGCPVGCRFCASGLGGLDGNLSAGRIVEQVWRLRDALRRPGPSRGGDPLARITHVVFMGMGEPLANFGPVTRAIRTLNAPWGLGIGARRITVSTVGLPAAIRRLAEQLDVPVTLALSLHAPTDELRRQLIPWAEYSTIRELLEACQAWFEKTGREITLEYTLLRGVNDRPEHARELARLAKTMRANVNLIRFNEVAGVPFQRPDDGDVLAFQSTLRDRQVNVHIRASRGRDIAAACGQLRHEHAAGAGEIAETRGNGTGVAASPPEQAAPAPSAAAAPGSRE